MGHSSEYRAPMGNGLPPKCGEIIKVKDGAEDRPNEERQKISTHGVPYGWGMARVPTVLTHWLPLKMDFVCAQQQRERERQQENEKEREIARQ